MTTENYKVRDLTPTMLRLNPELRHRLLKTAKAHGRSLNKEIEVLLQEALDRADHPYAVGAHTRPATAQEPGADTAMEISPLQQAMLGVFDRLPPEKQLALLSLFK